MGWIDSSAWDPAQGKRLVQLFAEEYSDEVLVEALLVRRQHPETFPAQRQPLDGAVLDEPRRGSPQQPPPPDAGRRRRRSTSPRWGRCSTRWTRPTRSSPPPRSPSVTPCVSCDPGNRPFINRVDLRDRLQKLIEERLPRPHRPRPRAHRKVVQLRPARAGPSRRHPARLGGLLVARFRPVGQRPRRPLVCAICPGPLARHGTEDHRDPSGHRAGSPLHRVVQPDRERRRRSSSSTG